MHLQVKSSNLKKITNKFKKVKTLALHLDFRFHLLRKEKRQNNIFHDLKKIQSRYIDVILTFILYSFVVFFLIIYFKQTILNLNIFVRSM